MAAPICLDITVCTPVFDDADKEILFWVASRGHHADVGGTAPGSMSPRATNIEEEGVYIDNFKIVDQGRFCEEDLIKLLTGARYPVRNVVQNVNDLKAQIAANAKGVAELRKMIALRSGSMSCRPTWAMCRTTRPRACPGFSPSCTTANSPIRWIRAARSR